MRIAARNGRNYFMRSAYRAQCDWQRRTNMISKLKYILDPLDREVLDRAFDEAWAAVHAKANALIESGNDEELETLLRRELMEIASFNGLDEQIVQKILCDSGLDL
jgi:hypothetical protein